MAVLPDVFTVFSVLFVSISPVLVQFRGPGSGRAGLSVYPGSA